MEFILDFFLGPLLLGSAVFVAITFLLSRLVFPGSGSRGPHDTLSSRLTGVFFLIFTEWLATIWTVGCLPFRAARSKSKHIDSPEVPIPVILLPGFLENAATMSVLRRRLEKRLKVPVVTLTPARYFSGLEVLLYDYRRQILAWMEQLQAEKIDLVGHSMGGLLARSLVEKKLIPHVTRHVITIGSPHQGSAISVFGFLIRSLRQMKRGSAYLEEINKLPTPESVKFIGICSTHDNLVMPWNSGLSPRGDNFILRFQGHLALVLLPEIAKMVAKQLKDG